MTSRLGRLLLAAFVPLAIVASAAADTPSKCASAKIKATGKKASARAKCYGKAVAKGEPVSTDCLDKASVKFGSAFSKAETKADCHAPTGDSGTIENKVDAFVDNVRDIVNSSAAGPNPCDSKKIQAAGKKAGNKAKCHAKAASKGVPVDSTCLAKAETKFSASISKAETAGPSCTHSGQTNTLESAVDAFINDANGELTSCGNGTIDPGEGCDGTNLGGVTCSPPAGASLPTCKPDCTLDCSSCPSGCQVTCEPIVASQPIPNTYQMIGIPGPKLCVTNSASPFAPCSNDAGCGGASGSCVQTPWVTADGFAFPFPTNISTTFTVSSATPAPSCEHPACITCGNPDAACVGIPGCGAPPDPPVAPCVRNTCCDTPGFVVPTFNVPILGGLCGRVDQVACGVGVVNTSHPQTGDNEVTKVGDTSDPGDDCTYGTLDDPAAKPCDTSPTGAGADTKGKVVRTVGNTQPDAPGIQYRITTPEMATVWSDSQNPCPPGSTYDTGEMLVSQLVLNAEPTTAGATGAFADLNGDMCAHAGAGFSNASPDGPITVGPPPAAAIPYGGGNSIPVAAGPVFSGSAPLFDIGFIAITPNGSPTIVAPESCSCTPVPGCPE